MNVSTTSEESLRRYIEHASYRCYQELLTDSRGDENEGWKSIKNKSGISISRRREGNKVTVRGQCVLDISADQFQGFTSAIGTAKQWDKSFKEGECLHRIEHNLNILRLVFGQNGGPLFRNREFIVHERKEVLDDGTVVVAVVSVPQEMASGIYPPSKRLVRGRVIYSGWVVERLEQSNACMATYIVEVDPGGWIPKCVANTLLVKLVFFIFHLYKLASSVRESSSML